MAKLNHPNDRRYAETHEWVRVEGDEAVIGISDYAQDSLGDVVYLDPEKQGRPARQAGWALRRHRVGEGDLRTVCAGQRRGGAHQRPVDRRG